MFATNYSIKVDAATRRHSQNFLKDFKTTMENNDLVFKD